MIEVILSEELRRMINSDNIFYGVNVDIGVTDKDQTRVTRYLSDEGVNYSIDGGIVSAERLSTRQIGAITEIKGVLRVENNQLERSEK